MNKIIAITILGIISCSCGTGKPKKYKHVVDISKETKTYRVTVTNGSGGNSIKRGAGGAIIGGGVDMLLGGGGRSGAVIGGLIGAATTSEPKSESYTEMRTDTTYTVFFSDSTTQVFNKYCRFSIGDSTTIYY